MPKEKRDCPHCGAKFSLRYYHEIDSADAYYCEKCFRIVSWNGEGCKPINGEAYPDRFKGQKKKVYCKNCKWEWHYRRNWWCNMKIPWENKAVGKKGVTILHQEYFVKLKIRIMIVLTIRENGGSFGLTN